MATQGYSTGSPQRLFVISKQILILARFCRYPVGNGYEYFAKFPS